MFCVKNSIELYFYFNINCLFKGRCCTFSGQGMGLEAFKLWFDISDGRLLYFDFLFGVHELSDSGVRLVWIGHKKLKFKIKFLFISLFSRSYTKSHSFFIYFKILYFFCLLRINLTEFRSQRHLHLPAHQILLPICCTICCQQCTLSRI